MAVFSPGGDGTVGLYTDPLVMTRDDTLRIDLGGAGTNQYDRVQISDAAQFDGTLSVHLVDGFDPAVGTTFQVVSSEGSAGAFTALSLPNMADGKRLAPVLRQVA